MTQNLQNKIKQELRKNRKQKGKERCQSCLLSIPGALEQRFQGATPDFLLISRYRYDESHTLQIGSEDPDVAIFMAVNWIDCKNFVGGVSRLLDKKTAQQSSKYHRIFGTGAVVFKYGYTISFMKFCERLNRKAICLNYDMLANLKQIKNNANYDTYTTSQLR